MSTGSAHDALETRSRLSGAAASDEFARRRELPPRLHPIEPAPLSSDLIRLLFRLRLRYVVTGNVALSCSTKRNTVTGSARSPCEGGRGIFPDLTLGPQGPVLAAQADQLGPLVGRQTRRLAVIDGRLTDPQAERLIADPEVPGDLADGVARLAGQADRFSPELGRYGGLGFGMWTPGSGLDRPNCWVSTKPGQLQYSFLMVAWIYIPTDLFGSLPDWIKPWVLIGTVLVFIATVGWAIRQRSG